MSYEGSNQHGSAKGHFPHLVAQKQKKNHNQTKPLIPNGWKLKTWKHPGYHQESIYKYHRLFFLGTYSR